MAFSIAAATTGFPAPSPAPFWRCNRDHLDSPKLGNGESAAFFPIFTTTVEGIKYVDPLLIGAAASLAASERDIFRYAVLPATLPNIITGLRIGFGLSFFVIVAAEFIPANSGLGFIDGTRR